MPIKVKVNNDWIEVTAKPSDDLPLANEDVASAGESNYYSRADHVHPKQEMPDIPVASNSNPIDLGIANPGTSIQFSRADHVHNLPSIPIASNNVPSNLGNASSGISDSYARADHIHNLPEIPSPSNELPLENDIANSGSSFEYARADHVHPVSSSNNAIKWNGSNKIISNDPPSGGENGDIWFQILN